MRTRRPARKETAAIARTASTITETVKAAAPPQLKSLTSWKIVIVATVVDGVKRKIRTERVVIARTKEVVSPVTNGPRSIGKSTSRKERSESAPRIAAASSIDLSI